MKLNRLLAMGAGAAITTELLMGCSSSTPATPAEQASASSAAASKAYEDAKSNEVTFAESYDPNGTREIELKRSGYGLSSMVEFCLNATTVGIATERFTNNAGSSVGTFTDPNACQDGRITPEDHLPLPTDLPLNGK